MTQVLDAPWIRDAETNGVGYEEQTEQEYRSGIYQDSVSEGLQKARKLIEYAARILEGLPEDTIWQKAIEDLTDATSDLGFQYMNLNDEVERW